MVISVHVDGKLGLYAMLLVVSLYGITDYSSTAWFFYVVGTGQMIIWAIKKHKSYRKEFGSDYPRGRKIMFPFLY